jgi:hypothetical protein
MTIIKQILKGFKRGLGLFGENISTIVNTLLLSVVYLIGIGLTSIFAKITGKVFLKMKLSSKVDTYWLDLNQKVKSDDEYYRQF